MIYTALVALVVYRANRLITGVQIIAPHELTLRRLTTKFGLSKEDITEQSDEEEQPVRNFSADLETNFTDEELKKMEAEFDQDFGFNPSKDHDKDQ